MAIDNSRHWGLKPVVIFGEVRPIREAPVDRVVQRHLVRVVAVGDGLDDQLRERPRPRFGVEAGLWDGCRLRAHNLIGCKLVVIVRIANGSENVLYGATTGNTRLSLVR